jgi:HSP20 family protein
MSNRKGKEPDDGHGFDGILSGLTGLVEKINELAKTGKELHDSGEFGGGSGKQKWQGVYGFKVRTGLGDEGPTVEPFGNVHKDRDQGYTVTPEVLEPVVDLFEEADHTLVVLEMPGVGLDDIQWEIQDDSVTVDADSGGKKYHKEVLLPRSYAREALHLSCNNGILEIKCSNS